MNDRFRFRAWDGERMIPHSELNEIGGFFYSGNIDADQEWVDQLYGEPTFTLMQSTGLKDKNGTLIYEGDIVNFHFSDGDEKNNDSGVGHIVFSDFSASFGLEADHVFQELWADESMWDLEVQGNIYENPELLTQRQ